MARDPLMMRVVIPVCLFFYLLEKIYHYYLKSLWARVSDYPTSHDYAISQLLKFLLVSQYQFGLGRKSMKAAWRIRGWSGKFGVAAPSCKGLQFIIFFPYFCPLRSSHMLCFVSPIVCNLGFLHTTYS
jgi:hypothetical protein